MQPNPTIRKQRADSVPYGECIGTRGGYVWCAYDGDRLVVVASTVGEARRRYRKALMDYDNARSVSPSATYDPGGGRNDGRRMPKRPAVSKPYLNVPNPKLKD